MKKFVFILLFLVGASHIYSQIEKTQDSLPDFNKLLLPDREIFNNYLQVDKPDINAINVFSPDYRPFKKPDISPLDLDLPPIIYYQGPLINDNPILRKYPFVNDYAFHAGYILTDKLWLSTSSTQNTYPTLGRVRSVSGQVNYKLTNWLFVSGGAYGAKYHIYNNHYNDIGANGSLKLILHDRIRLNGYSQYSVFAKRNGIGSTMGMFPQTYYGGTVELKLTEKFGVEGGIIREFNPLNGKWVNRPYIAPVFYNK